MPVRKLKPIEERDPYAAAVLNAFDELQEKFPAAETIQPTAEELAAEKRCAELAEKIQHLTAPQPTLKEMAVKPTEIDKLKEALRLSLAYSADLGWALDAQQAVNAQLCKEIANLEWLIRDCKANVFWHSGASAFVIGEWRYQGPTLAEAISFATKGFQEKAK